MNLGSASDWSITIALLFSVAAIVAAVWKLARAASHLESAIIALRESQQAIVAHLDTHVRAFQEYQRDQARVTADLQSAVNRLTWEVNRSRGG